MSQFYEHVYRTLAPIFPTSDYDAFRRGADMTALDVFTYCHAAEVVDVWTINDFCAYHRCINKVIHSPDVAANRASTALLAAVNRSLEQIEPMVPRRLRSNACLSHIVAGLSRYVSFGTGTSYYREFARYYVRNAYTRSSPGFLPHELEHIPERDAGWLFLCESLPMRFCASSNKLFREGMPTIQFGNAEAYGRIHCTDEQFLEPLGSRVRQEIMRHVSRVRQEIMRHAVAFSESACDILPGEET